MTALTVMDFLLSFTMMIITFLSVALYLAYNLRAKYSYWARRGVPYVKPALFFGNTKNLVLQRVPITFAYNRIYKELHGHRFGGFYHMTKPCVIIRDPQLIKTVLVKNFTNFIDRVPRDVDKKLDPFASNPFNLLGQRWRYCRTTMTQAFSPRKLREMGHLIKNCIVELQEYLTNVTDAGDSNTGDAHDVTELMADFVTDVHGSYAMGFRCNSIKDNSSEFRRILRKISEFRIHLRVLLRVVCPQLIDFFKIKGHSYEVEEFFLSRIQKAVHDRETSGQKGNDVLQLMIDLRAEKKAQLQGYQQNAHQKNGHHRNGRQEDDTHVEKSWLNKNSDDATSGSESSVIHGSKKLDSSVIHTEKNELLFLDTLVAPITFVFFHSGIETVSSALSYCIYELALNPEICEKMKAEVESVKLVQDGDLGHSAMTALVYMETVILETLRKYPVTPVSQRLCTEPFKIPDSSVVIEKGTPIFISIYSLHHDPKYFPAPEKFLPERFSEENKGSIVPGSYLPFGDGPRICVAKRFVIFQMKSVLSHLVRNYTFHPCEKTGSPLKFSRRSLQHMPEGGIWVRFRKRSK